MCPTALRVPISVSLRSPYSPKWKTWAELHSMDASGCLSPFVGRYQSVLRARFEVLPFASAGQVSVRVFFTASLVGI